MFKRGGGEDRLKRMSIIVQDRLISILASQKNS